MYESYFGFNDKPFKLTPDPRFFYASENHNKAMSYLHYGFERGDGFVVITGTSGMGKTTVACNLTNSLDSRTIIIKINTASLSSYDIIKMIALNCDLPVSGLSKAEILMELEQYFHLVHQKDKRVLIVIDEAHHLLPEQLEELRMLSNFQFDNRPPVQTFLFGSIELEKMIRAPGMEQFRQRIIASCQLNAFDLKDTHAYIEDRLRTSGWEGTPMLDRSVYSLIKQQTLGIPRKINLLMDRVFLFAYLSEVKFINVNILKEVLVDMSDDLSFSIEEPIVNQHMTEITQNEESINVFDDDADVTLTVGSTSQHRVDTYAEFDKCDQPSPKIVVESQTDYEETHQENIDLELQADPKIIVEKNSNAEVEKVIKILELVSDALDKMIVRKLATIQYFDKMIIKKRRQSSMSYTADKSDESILNEDKVRKV
ncbi:ExeA family protein [Photobacterium nomapromontoriensis]|uniref:ExeA family protein n=1 Tax=Photobacterium nomapromontoriensis TaxID=2910237 RepID=UPI003D0AD793